MPSPDDPSAVVVIGLILLWSAINIGVLIYNKYVLSSTHFDYSCFLTLCHMTACVIVGFLVQSLSGYFPLQPLVSRKQFYKVCILSVIFCASIVLGNASLEYIPVSFNQAIGATTPFFTAVLALAILGQRETTMTYCTLIPIVMGIIIASEGEPVFHVLGTIFCVISTATRGLKTVIQALLMTDSKERLDPMSLLFYMSAVACVLLVPLTVMYEPDAFLVAHIRCQQNPNFVWVLISNSVLAWVLNLINFLVTKYTSALTIQVLGQAKGVLGAVISVWIFHNMVTLQGWMGYGLAVVGVLGYTFSVRYNPPPPPLSAVEAALAHGKVPLDVDPEKHPLMRAPSGIPHDREREKEREKEQREVNAREYPHAHTVHVQPKTPVHLPSASPRLRV